MTTNNGSPGAACSCGSSSVVGRCSCVNSPPLPPGYGLEPTDEEVLYYLEKKKNDHPIPDLIKRMIPQVDLYKDLPNPKTLPADGRWKLDAGQKRWYFFTLLERRHRNGERTKRTTSEGLWRANGSLIEIIKDGNIIGSKRTLVFRPATQVRQKNSWLMHEYRCTHSSLDEWVVCMIYNKEPESTKQDKLKAIVVAEEHQSLATSNNPSKRRKQLNWKSASPYCGSSDQQENNAQPIFNHFMNNLYANTDNMQSYTATHPQRLSGQVFAEDQSVVATSQGVPLPYQQGNTQISIAQPEQRRANNVMNNLITTPSTMNYYANPDPFMSYAHLSDDQVLGEDQQAYNAEPNIDEFTISPNADHI